MTCCAALIAQIAQKRADGRDTELCSQMEGDWVVGVLERRPTWDHLDLEGLHGNEGWRLVSCLGESSKQGSSCQSYSIQAIYLKSIAKVLLPLVPISDSTKSSSPYCSRHTTRTLAKALIEISQ